MRNGRGKNALNTLVGSIPLAKQQRDAPKGRQTNQSVNHPADRRCLTAEQKGNQIQPEQAHTAPVQPAHNGKNQGNSIHDHPKRSFQITPRIIDPQRKQFSRRYGFYAPTKVVIFRVFSLFTKRIKERMVILQLIQLAMMTHQQWPQAHIFIPQPCFPGHGPGNFFIDNKLT